mmetsp:Transcript_13294/g.37801  ORF Transcript_13294/g.37801 Transcript_13294/m.37801 type:complete len:202 (-) Transcript_13294:14-619(-)
MASSVASTKPLASAPNISSARGRSASRYASAWAATARRTFSSATTTRSSRGAAGARANSARCPRTPRRAPRRSFRSRSIRTWLTSIASPNARRSAHEVGITIASSSSATSDAHAQNSSPRRVTARARLASSTCRTRSRYSSTHASRRSSTAPSPATASSAAAVTAPSLAHSTACSACTVRTASHRRSRSTRTRSISLTSPA